jgi:hypothetical protein
VEEARAVIARLERIEAMERAQEPAELVLGQLALLAVDAERWLETEQTAGAAARKALERCLDALERASALDSRSQEYRDTRIRAKTHSIG